MTRFLYIASFIISAALPFFTLAQAPAITTSVNRKEILIGQQIEYNVQVHMPDNSYRLTWFADPKDFGSFVIASKSKIDSGYANGTLSFSQKLSITSFDSGRQVIPPLEFNFDYLQKDSSFRMYTDSIPIDVGYSPADSVLPFHDIKTIIPVQKESDKWFWPVVIAIIVLLVIILILILRKKKKKIPAAIFNHTLSPFDEAIKHFEELKSRQLPEKGRFNIYFASLSDIVKRYLSRNQNKNLMALTGTELIEAVTDMVPRETVIRIASGIRMGEAAKFAKFQPSQKECSETLDEMQHLVEAIHATTKLSADDL